MIRKDYPKMIDLFADEGKELVKAVDGVELRTSRVSCPVGEESEWTEIDIGAYFPSELETAFAEIESALNG